MKKIYTTLLPFIFIFTFTVSCKKDKPVYIGAKGDTGATGATGTTGATGPKGDKGDAGATGAAGTNGTNGIDGATGATGTTGANGTTGATGANGVNGTNGNDGAAGTNGTNGATGTQGANGTNGIDGATGATGPQGAPGIPAEGGSIIYTYKNFTMPYEQLNQVAGNVLQGFKVISTPDYAKTYDEGLVLVYSRRSIDLNDNFKNLPNGFTLDYKLDANTGELDANSGNPTHLLHYIFDQSPSGLGVTLQLTLLNSVASTDPDFIKKLLTNGIDLKLLYIPGKLLAGFKQSGVDLRNLSVVKTKLGLRD